MKNIIYKIIHWLGLDFITFAPTPFDDVAHAGEFKGRTLTLTQILTLRVTSMLASAKDALFTDVSRWQTVIDFLKMALAGARGTIIKCGQGLGIDPYFKTNWQKAKGLLKRGSYWYYDSRVDPKEQARLWWEAIRDDIGELPHFADYEENYNGPFAGVANFAMFLLEFQRLSRLPDEKIGVYTGYYYWIAHGANDSFFSRFWLWIAWYGDSINVLIPKPWAVSRVWGWQWTSSGPGSEYGVSSHEIDLNWFVKGLDVFETMYGVTKSPETGEPMTGKYEVWSDLYAMSLREEPTVYAAKVGTSLPIKVRVMADALVPPKSGGVAGDLWAHVVQRDGLPVDLYMAVIHNGVTYCQYREIDERPMPHIRLEFTDRDGTVWFMDGDMSKR